MTKTTAVRDEPSQPTTAATDAAPSLPRWVPWLFLGLLTLPMHPYWVDFEQVRRALLLLLCGGALLAWPALRPVAGERWLWLFVLGMALCASVNWCADVIGKEDTEARSFQSWEAIYRLGHWVALVVALRLGAACGGGARVVPPLAALLAAAATFGVLQRLGLAEIAGYGVDREPVSLFGNLNVASEWTAITACAVATLLPTEPSRLRTFCQAALALAGAYLVVNGSRSGMVALPIVLLVLAALRRERGLAALLPLALAAGGGVLGMLVSVLGTTPPADQAEAIAAQKRGTATLQVRWEINKGSTRLFAESPVFGQGPGQFAVQYPRVRSAEEIELSSNRRQFATEVRTAHDDWLELLVDGGLPGLLLFAAALLMLQRRQPDKARLLPLLALLLLMLVRAPLLNAPAVAVALLLVGVGGSAPRRPGPTTQRWLTRAVGVVLVAMAVPVLAAHQAMTTYQRAAARGEDAPLAAVNDAVAWMPWEPRWLHVQTQELLAAGHLADARRAAARALQLRPFDPELALRLGEVLARGTAYEEAARIALFGLDIDPHHPELRVLLATTLLLRGLPDAAVDAVVVEPHERLRQQLRTLFRSLAEQAALRGDAQGQARMRVEQHFLEGLDALGDTSDGGLDAAKTAVTRFLASLSAAGRKGKDLRGHVVAALHALDLEDEETAIHLGAAAAALGVDLLPWQQDLLGDRLARLATLGKWPEVLRR